MEIIHADQAPAAVGPYAHAVRTGDTVYLSGQIGLDPQTGDLAGETTLEQLEQVLRNIDAVLTAANLQRANIAKVTVYLTDMSEFATVNEVYAVYFGEHTPAREAVAVAALPKGARIEFSVIAVA